MKRGDLKSYLRSHRPDATDDPDAKPPTLKVCYYLYSYLKNDTLKLNVMWIVLLLVCVFYIIMLSVNPLDVVDCI